MDPKVFLQLVFLLVVAESMATQQDQNLTTAEIDEMNLSSLNSSQYLVQFCNSYCEGHEKKAFINLDFLTTPLCMECSCDKHCGFYGDCCPDIHGNIISEPNPPSCLYSGNDLDIQSKIGFGIFMVTECQGHEVKDNVFSPVTSESLNVSYFNKEIAECNNVANYTPWSLQLDCSSGESSGDHDPTGLDLVDHLYDNEEECQFVYSSTRITNPRLCDPMLASTSRVSECNVTNVWVEFDEETSSACRHYNYPVTYRNVVYANIFCAICNGVVPGRSPLQSLGIDLPPPITVITQFSRPRRDPLPPEITCSSDEWLDPVKAKCHQISCAPGKKLIGEECTVNVYDVSGDEYMFNVLLKPEDNAYDVITQWNRVLQMFMENFKRFMSSFRVTNYKFSIGLIEDIKAVDLLNYEYTKGVLIKCNFIVTGSTNRTEFENQIYGFATGIWELKFDGHNYNFTSVLSNVPIAKVKLKANYWAYPVTGECCISVADNFDLKKTNIEASSRVVDVTNELFCPYVKLSKGEYETEMNGWINLKSINISISSSDFSFDKRRRARICLDVLNDVFNGSYIGRRNNIKIPASVLAQQILSLVCVTLSILCLAFTLVTYCTFPSLRSLPAKNNMMLMGNLFIAQSLFQFGIDKTENRTVCIIIGVSIHYSWLCVAFWMNACSFHMLRVFGVSLLPQSKCKHGKTLLRYCIYSFGSSALVVVMSLSVNLIMSRGLETGYGGVVCYLATTRLVGFSFVMPLTIILTMNITFFAVTVRAISKIENLKRHGMKDRNNVYVYVKLSSLTGMFWIVAVLAEVFREEVLVYISIILNGSLGVFLFFCYAANRRVYELWKGLFDRLRKTPLEESQTGTVSTSA